MGAIYQNAYCNLSVAAASDAQGNLFAMRDPRLVDPLSMVLQPDVWSIQVTEELASQRFVCFRKDYWDQYVNQASVNQRGWVLQERMLSRRKIFFAHRQVFWECRRKRACETFPDKLAEQLVAEVFHRKGIQGLLTKTIDELSLRGATVSTVPTLARDEQVRLLKAWNSFLKLFTDCNMTYRDDRTMAIKGIADFLEKALGDGCLSGLWRNELPYQLVYSIGFLHQSKDSFPSLAKLPCNIRVPSWTWAYYDAPIQIAPRWMSESDMSFVSVEDIRYGDNAKLTLDGTELNTIPLAILELFGYVFHCNVDPRNGAPDPDYYKNFRILVHVGDQTVEAIVHYDHSIQRNAFVLPIFGDKSWSSVVQAIVLCELVRSGSRIFQRCGYLGVNRDLTVAFQKFLETGVERERLYLI